MIDPIPAEGLPGSWRGAAKLPEGWKIIALSGAQRREGCGQGK